MACADGGRAPSPHDAGGLQPQTQVDPIAASAGSGASEQLPDGHFLLIALMVEVEHSLQARCPCEVENGGYKTIRDCVAAASLGRDWVDCVNNFELPEQDDEAFRENLRCNVDELSQRSSCLQGSACREEDIDACFAIRLGCEMPSVMILSRLATECPIRLSH